MELLYLATSPFARKVLVAAYELDVADRFTVRAVETSPLRSDPDLVRRNPLGRVPTLLRDDAPAIYESGVICEYLDHLAGEGRLVPQAGERRWQSRRLHALADGISEAGIAIRREASRPAELQWADWSRAFADKLARTYDLLEGEPELYEGEVEIGQVALATALEWVMQRAAGPAPLEGRPRLAAWYAAFAARRSMTRVPFGELPA